VNAIDSKQTQLGLTAPGHPGYALIIEDEPLIAASIEAELQDLGFRSFQTARNEREALLLAKRELPAFITVDAKLEEGSGVEALVKICATRAVPSIVVTGNPFDVSVPGVVTLGKPFSPPAFAVAYEQALARPFRASELSAA
jgi:two-component system, response regulator PdtaR